MNSTTKGIISVVIVGALVYGVYMLTYGKKHHYATIILKFGKSTGTMAQLHTFDEKFLKSWAKASMRNEPTFTLDGKVYNTQGGSAKK